MQHIAEAFLESSNRQNPVYQKMVDDGAVSRRRTQVHSPFQDKNAEIFGPTQSLRYLSFFGYSFYSATKHRFLKLAITFKNSVVALTGHKKGKLYYARKLIQSVTLYQNVAKLRTEAMLLLK